MEEYKMKIVYCLNSISTLGGIEKVTIAKANALAEFNDYEIYIIITEKIDNDCKVNLSSKIKLIELDVNYYEYDWKSKWHLLKTYLVKGYKHKKILKRRLKEINPDIVISVGQSEKYILPSIKGNWKLIREIHYTSDYRRLQAKNLKDRIIAYLRKYYDYKWKIKKYDKIVLLTNEDKENHWRDKEKVIVIPNFLTFTTSHTPSSLLHKRVISIGRLEDQKNYRSLIAVFKTVVNKHPDWILEIFGEGAEKSNLRRQIDSLELSDSVKLMGNTSNPIEEMRNASIFVMSSKFEGFPLVVIESLSVGIPVVSYSCLSGPKDIISDGHDGFLVPQGNEAEMAEKINYLIENPEVRKKMGAAAYEKSKNYLPDKVIPLWRNLFISMTQKEL